MVTFDTFWIQNATTLLQFVRRKTPNAEIAEDILHDVYLKAKSHPALSEVRNTRAWVYQICRRTIADYYRSQNRDSFTPLSDDLTRGMRDAQSSVWRAVAEAVDCKIHHLPSSYQGAISLFALQGLSEKQVAEKLHLSLPATKSRILRARGKLRSLFTRCCAFEFDSSEPIVVWDEFEKNIMEKNMMSLMAPSYFDYSANGK